MVGAAYSQTGIKHEKNQDSYYIKHDKKSGIFIVADGMGGHAAGDVASRIAVEHVTANLIKITEKNIHDVIEIANSKILDEAKLSAAYEGMGTTITMCCVDGKEALIAHIGDSRAYIVEEGNIFLATHDHSLVQQMVDKGEITGEEAKRHSMKNIITRALGVQESVQPDIIKYKIKPGTVIMLCSDGVSNVLSDEEMGEIVTNHEPEQAVEILCHDAAAAGSSDDLTAIVIKF